VLVIEGIKTNDPPSISRRFCRLVGVLVVASVLAVLAWTITRQILASNQSNEGADTMNQTLLPPQIPPRAVPMNINTTIGDALNGGSDPVDFLLRAGSGDFFETMLNRTDTTFTLFSVARDVSTFSGIDFASYAKLLSSFWVGHVVRT
jgi:hypothetical protein